MIRRASKPTSSISSVLNDKFGRRSSTKTPSPRPSPTAKVHSKQASPSSTPRSSRNGHSTKQDMSMFLSHSHKQNPPTSSSSSIINETNTPVLPTSNSMMDKRTAHNIVHPSTAPLPQIHLQTQHNQNKEKSTSSITHPVQYKPTHPIDLEDPCQQWWLMWLLVAAVSFIIGILFGALLESTALHMFSSECTLHMQQQVPCDATSEGVSDTNNNNGVQRKGAAILGSLIGPRRDTDNDQSQSMVVTNAPPRFTANFPSQQSRPSRVQTGARTDQSTAPLCVHGSSMIEQVGQHFTAPNSLTIRLQTAQQCRQSCEQIGTCTRATFSPAETTCFMETSDQFNCTMIHGRTRRVCPSPNYCVLYKKSCTCPLDDRGRTQKAPLRTDTELSTVAGRVLCGNNANQQYSPTSMSYLAFVCAQP